MTQHNSHEVEWQNLPASEICKIAARDGSLAILPIGALEQHGPHLPVITDTISASTVAIAAARLVADDMPVAVLPGLWLGMSEHHLPFGGTISVDYATMRAMLNCIARSLVSGGFKRLLIVNGHGGNIDPLAVAAVSYTHLDVSKRQTQNCASFALVKTSSNLIGNAFDSRFSAFLYLPFASATNSAQLVFPPARTH